MALFKRISDGFWSYLSPRKPDATQIATPQTAPPVFKRGKSPRPRQPSLDDVVRQTKSMTPVERVDSWRAQSSMSDNSKMGGKRKSPMTPSTFNGRHRKGPRLNSEVSHYESDIEDEDGYDEDSVEEGVEDDAEADAEDIESDDNDSDGGDSEAIQVNDGRSPTPADHESYYDEFAEGDTSLLVSDRDYFESPGRKKIISPTKEAFDRGITEEELREQGWDDDHIVLVQKIAMRGYEPLLPNYYKLEWPFMPDALFAEDDDAILTTVCGRFFRGSKALERLFELGGRVRDRVQLNGRITPEQQTKIMVKEYIKWAQADGSLDKKTAIPLLTIEAQSASTPAVELQERAREKLAALAARYEAAFRVKQSIEDVPSTHEQTILSQPIPTLYAIIASGTLIALVAYNAADEDPDVKPIAFFQMNDKAYDVWNALALAIVICHVRNVQIRIAEETGIGLKAADDVKEEVDDPDL